MACFRLSFLGEAESRRLSWCNEFFSKFIPSAQKWSAIKSEGIELLSDLNCSDDMKERAVKLLEHPKNLVKSTHFKFAIIDLSADEDLDEDMCRDTVERLEAIVTNTLAEEAPIEALQGMIKNMYEEDNELLDIQELQTKLVEIAVPEIQEQVLHIRVKRDEHILSSILDAVGGLGRHDLLECIMVAFLDSEGNDEGSIDAGGLMRELLTLAFRELGNSENGFFAPLEESANKLWFHPQSLTLHDPTIYEIRARFIAIGRLLGLAIRHRITIPVSFIPAFYKAFSKDSELTPKDILRIDPFFLNTFAYITSTSLPREDAERLLNADYVEAGSAEEFFYVDTIYGDEEPLVKDGENIQVCSENLTNFFHDQIYYAGYARYRESLKAIKEGLFDVVPAATIREFTAFEIDKMLYGQDKIDVADWKAHTTELNCNSSHQAAINWFWEFLESASDEVKADVLQFSTGSRSQPITGMFREKPFQIKCTSSEVGRTIRASTCFNQIKMPPFASHEQFLEMMKLAIASKEGFAAESAVH